MVIFNIVILPTSNPFHCQRLTLDTLTPASGAKMQLSVFRPSTGCQYILNALALSQIYQLEIMRQMKMVNYCSVEIASPIPPSWISSFKRMWLMVCTCSFWVVLVPSSITHIGDTTYIYILLKYLLERDVCSNIEGIRLQSPITGTCGLLIFG